MGRKIHIDEVREFIRTTPVFRSRDVELLVGERRYALLMLHNLAKKGEIHRVARGWYSSGDDPTVAVFALAPAYLGLQEALSIRGAWEQETNTVVVTCGQARPGARDVFESRVIVRRLDPRYFFGFDHVPYGGYQVPVSDVEKTLIDLVYFREEPGHGVIRRLVKRSDKETLSSYLHRYPEKFRATFESRVGFTDVP